MCLCFSKREGSYITKLDTLDKEQNHSNNPSNTIELQKQNHSFESPKTSQTNKEILVARDSPICHIKRCSVDTGEYRYRIHIHNKTIVAHNRHSCQINR